MTERVEEALGQRPEAVLADGSNATGPNIVELEQRGIEFLSPASTVETTEGNPAVRNDPRQPVPEDAWPKLPINPHTKKLDKSCFVFVPEENVYYCPRRRDAVRLAEAGLGTAAILVARIGEGPNGVALGVYRVQSEKTDPGGEMTARQVRGVGHRSSKLRKVGNSRGPVFPAFVGQSSAGNSARTFWALRSSPKKIARSTRDR